MSSLFIVSAPSGAGKTSLVKASISGIDNLELSVAPTTRPPRTCELNCFDYHFVSPETSLGSS